MEQAIPKTYYEYALVIKKVNVNLGTDANNTTGKVTEQMSISEFSFQTMQI
jgi:hypothetical protein